MSRHVRIISPASAISTIRPKTWTAHKSTTAARSTFFRKTSWLKNNYAYHLSESTDDPERLAEAEALSYATVTAEPDNPTYLDTYAWILFKQRDYTRAKEYIDRAFDHQQEGNEPSAEYYMHAGDIYFWNQQPDKAVEFWKKALDLDPDNELLARKVKYKTYFHE